MKLVNTQKVYSFILTEDEWYSATEQQREAWQVQILREASEYRCQFAAILVDPDPIMSISPVPRRHKVWGHTFPTAAEADFKIDLKDVIKAGREGGINNERIAAILREFAEEVK